MTSKPRPDHSKKSVTIDGGAKPSPEVTAAATKIQSAQRGARDRRKAKEMQIGRSTTSGSEGAPPSKVVEVRDLPTWETRGREVLPPLRGAALDAWNKDLKEFPYFGPRRLIRPDLNKALIIIRGDICRIKAGIIVCAFEQNKPTGIEGKIHYSAGSSALGRELAKRNCPNGGTTITNHQNCASLPAEYIIHAGVPRKAKGDVLQSCYAGALEEVDNLGVRSVAFTPLGTGEGYMYKQVQAAQIALSTTRDWLEKLGENLPPSQHIIFCPSDEDELQVLLRLADHYFPCSHVGDVQAHQGEQHALVSSAALVRSKLSIHQGDKDSDRSKAKVAQIFYDWDKGGNGVITRAEMSDVFKQLLPNLTQTNLDQLFKSIDKDDSGYIDYDEFLEFIFSSVAQS